MLRLYSKSTSGGARFSGPTKSTEASHGIPCSSLCVWISSHELGCIFFESVRETLSRLPCSAGQSSERSRYSARFGSTCHGQSQGRTKDGNHQPGRQDSSFPKEYPSSPTGSACACLGWSARPIWMEIKFTCERKTVRVQHAERNSSTKGMQWGKYLLVAAVIAVIVYWVRFSPLPVTGHRVTRGEVTGRSHGNRNS